MTSARTRADRGNIIGSLSISTVDPLEQTNGGRVKGNGRRKGRWRTSNANNTIIEMPTKPRRGHAISGKKKRAHPDGYECLVDTNTGITIIDVSLCFKEHIYIYIYGCLYAQLHNLIND